MAWKIFGGAQCIKKAREICLSRKHARIVFPDKFVLNERTYVTVYVDKYNKKIGFEFSKYWNNKAYMIQNDNSICSKALFDDYEFIEGKRLKIRTEELNEKEITVVYFSKKEYMKQRVKELLKW